MTGMDRHDKMYKRLYIHFVYTLFYFTTVLLKCNLSIIFH